MFPNPSDDGFEEVFFVSLVIEMNEDGLPLLEDRLARTQPVPEEVVFLGQARPVIKHTVRGSKLLPDQAIDKIEGRRRAVKIKKVRAAVSGFGLDAKDELGDDAELSLRAE